MHRRLFSILVVLLLSASAAVAATFEYDIQITDISGAGEAQNIGFFSTGIIGDTGTGSARTVFPAARSTPGASVM